MVTGAIAAADVAVSMDILTSIRESTVEPPANARRRWNG